jgi:hypothetical protein
MPEALCQPRFAATGDLDGWTTSIADDQNTVERETQAIAGVEGIEEPEDTFEIW